VSESVNLGLGIHIFAWVDFALSYSNEKWFSRITMPSSFLSRMETLSYTHHAEGLVDPKVLIKRVSQSKFLEASSLKRVPRSEFLKASSLK
jgi:hypothetical protein